jgi:DNA-binding Lrp family transcriptional regulator
MEEEIRMNTRGFDVLDCRILERLKDDCRHSFRLVGKELGVPHTTVYTRALRMEERGLVNFRVSIVPDKIGLREAVVVIRVPIGFFDFFAENLENKGLVDLKQTDKGLLATFLFEDVSYLSDLEEMMIYLDKTFGYPVEAFSVSQSKELNNFSYVKKIIQKNGSNKEAEYGKKGKQEGSKKWK